MDIDDAAAGAAVLTRRLLAFSGRDIPNPRPLDLAEVVRELEPFLSRMVGAAVELVVDVHPRPVPIRADLLQIEQVVINLVENALDATPGGGRVVVEARTAEPDELPPQIRRPDQWALLRVSDSGPGVPEELRETIFEPFFTTKKTGTGLGLATVRSVASRLGGFVDLAESPDGGARFTVCFPRTEGAPPSILDPQERPDFPRGRTILVVEGDAATRSMAERILSEEGYRVLEAEDGVSALTLLEAYGGPLDLLVTALEMPHIGGEELAARLRATHPDADVLYLTEAGVRTSERAVRRDALPIDLLPAVEGMLGAPEASAVEPLE